MLRTVHWRKERRGNLFAGSLLSFVSHRSKFVPWEVKPCACGLQSPPPGQPEFTGRASERPPKPAVDGVDGTPGAGLRDSERLSRLRE